MEGVRGRTFIVCWPTWQESMKLRAAARASTTPADAYRIILRSLRANALNDVVRSNVSSRS